MARFYDPTPEEVTAWNEWVAERPPAIRDVAQRFDPWSLYRLKSSGHRVTVYSVDASDPVTVTVDVTGDFNAVTFERRVFGINPDDLEPCELPSPDEPVGAVMSREDVSENLDALRVAIRPDLWVMGEDGVAVRKQ